MNNTITQTKALQLTTGLLIAFAIAFFFYYGVNTINDSVFGIDFLPYHVAGRLLASGNVAGLTDYTAGTFHATAGPFLDAFHQYFFPNSPVGTRWIYLPAYAWLFRPLAALDFPTAARAWLIVNSILWLACIGLLWQARPWNGDPAVRDWRAAWILFLGVTFQPLLDNLWHGNVSALIFGAFCASYWLLRREKNFFAGLVLGLIVLMKFYPALFVLYFLWRRNWSFVAGVVVSCLAILAISLLTAGWAGNLAFAQMVIGELRAGGVPAFNNQSISGFLIHAFTQGDVNGWQNIAVPIWITAMRIALVLVMVGAVAWAMRRRPEQTMDASATQDLDLALVTGVMLLASPMTWYHYYLWLLLPLYVLLDHFLAAPTTNRRQLILFAVGYGLVVMQGIVVIRPFAAQALQDVWLLRVFLSTSFFGAVVLMYLLWRVRRAIV